MGISRKKFRTFFAIFVSRPTTKASEFSISVDPSVQWLMGNTAYDMKNIFCLFERPFKIQKNGVFRFELSFFVLEIFTFFYYAN